MLNNLHIFIISLSLFVIFVLLFVIPAKAGIQEKEDYIDPRVKPEDDKLSKRMFINYRLDPCSAVGVTQGSAGMKRAASHHVYKILC